MKTDTKRQRRTDPGEPNDCPVFTLHQAFVPQEKREEIVQGCRTAGIGCRDCKAVVLEYLLKALAPIQERRAGFEKNHLGYSRGRQRPGPRRRPGDDGRRPRSPGFLNADAGRARSPAESTGNHSLRRQFSRRRPNRDDPRGDGRTLN